ncbi:MAG TPA: HAD family hydrolase, partial [Thermomicrobiales bacterium]|nr:HAD family hydrolase [Thermomicrobiales bacterium]
MNYSEMPSKMTTIPLLNEKLRGILFDKDGTLVDFDRTWGPIIRHCTAYAAGGDPELSDRLLALGGMDLATGRTSADSLFAACNTAEIVDAFIEAGAPFTRADLIRDFDRMFVAASAEAVPIADTPALFAELKRRGLKIGIASSDNAASIAATARALGIDGVVDFVAGYDSGHGVKPAPGMFQAFCAAIGAPPGAVAMVGDNRHDMAMARAARAGLAIGVLSGT